MPEPILNPIQQDMAKLQSLLHDSLAPHLAPGQKDMRILNLACGRCDEAETLIQVGSDLTQGGAVVLPQPMPYVLLGNSFLTRFQMRRDNDILRLELR